MKKILSSITLFLIVILINTSCNKSNVEKSIPTFWPKIIINGSNPTVLLPTESYIELGATVTENGKAIEYVTDGEVGELPGVYTVTYTAINSDGIGVSAERTVAILPGPVTNDVDLSGKYETTPFAAGDPNYRYATITKKAPGTYYTTNCWGSGSRAVIPAYFFCLDGVNLIIPDQISNQRIFSVGNNNTIIDGVIVWTISRPNFFPNGLTLTKTWKKID